MNKPELKWVELGQISLIKLIKQQGLKPVDILTGPALTPDTSIKETLEVTAEVIKELMKQIKDRNR